jgi:fructose-bisphosphate aldolase class II
VDIEAIQKAIPHGVAKVNVDTDGRLAMTGAIRQVLMEHPEVFDPREYLGPARDALTAMVKQRMQQFGAAGHGSKIKQISLEEAKALYS